jgi:hypothetical protein
MESSVTTESSELPSLLRLTLDEYHQGLDTGAFSTLDLAKAYLQAPSSWASPIYPNGPTCDR